MPNPFARGGGGTHGGGQSGGGVSPPTPPSPPGGAGGTGAGGTGGGGDAPGGTGGGSGDQGFRPVSPGAGGGGVPTVGPSPDKGSTVAPTAARRIGISKGGRLIDLTPRTKVVTGSTLLRRPVIEQVGPAQIRTRNLAPTPILGASAGTARSVVTRQPVRTTVWWKRLPASKPPNQ